MAEYTFRIGNIYDNTVSVNIFVRVMEDEIYIQTMTFYF